MLGDSRDRCPPAEKAFSAQAPRQLMDYLQKNRSELIPEIRKRWESAGFKPSGTRANTK